MSSTGVLAAKADKFRSFSESFIKFFIIVSTPESTFPVNLTLFLLRVLGKRILVSESPFRTASNLIQVS